MFTEVDMDHLESPSLRGVWIEIRSILVGDVSILMVSRNFWWND